MGCPRWLLEVIIAYLSEREPMAKAHMKYIDDLSFTAAINLKENLKTDPNPARPQSYHERTNHFLPDDKNIMQEMFNNLSTYASDNQMVINGDKSKLMLFNQGRNYDFLPNIKTEAG